MSEKTRLTQVKITSRGPAQRVEGAGQANAMSFGQVVKKWAHAQDQVRELPWSQVPPEMLRDFLRVVVADMDASYGGQAQRKAMEVVGITLVEQGHTRARVDVAWLAAGARMDVSMLTRPLREGERGEPGVEFVLEGPKASDDQVRAALGEVARDRSDDRLVLDPVEQIGDKDLAKLMADIEALVVEQPDERTGSLLAGAAMLVIWRHMEKINAQTSEVVMSGLTGSGGKDIAQGMEVVLEATRVALDRSMDGRTDGPDTEATQVSRVRVPKH